MSGDLGDGFVTVYEDPDRVANELFPAVERGVSKSEHNEDFDDLHNSVHIHVSYADSVGAALEPCLPWRSTMLPIFFDADYADPRYLQQHGDRVSEETLMDAFVITDSVDDLVDVTETYVDAGFDEVVFQSSSPDQAKFCEAVERDVMPSF
jgi:coenzyme F420-dependent glucose-6-phosphate dehydrogenase